MQKTPIRTNVLLLVGGGYITLLVMFTVMAIWGEMKIDEAYEVVKGPLMALIGGSLAISKDLIPLGDTPSTESLIHHHPNGKDNQGGNESEPEKPA